MASPETSLQIDQIRLICRPIAEEVAAAVVRQVMIATGVDPNDPTSLAKRHARDAWTDAKMAEGAATYGEIKRTVVTAIVAAILGLLGAGAGTYFIAKETAPATTVVQARIEPQAPAVVPPPQTTSTR